MSIVANEGKNVLVNYNYMLRVEGIYDLPCKAVHSFTKENEFEYVQEGGLNDYVHMLRKPITKPFTFTVERYVGTDPIPPLPLGAELVLPVILMVSPFPDRFDISKRTFVFTGCTVMSKTFGELNAEKSGILTETIVIGYREMVEVTIPVHIGEDGSIWAFDEKKVEGKGKRSARTYERPEEDRVAKKRQWLVENNGVIKYVGDQSATDRSKFYEAVSEEDLLEKRYWRLSGPELIDQSVGDKQAGTKTENRVFKKSARTEPDTDAVVRRWNIAGDTKKMTIDGQTVEVPQLGGGEASARTEPDTDAVKRQWLAEEEGIYKNKGKQSARTREDFYKVDTDAAEGADAAVNKLPRQWLAEEEGIYKNKGNQSARTREDFYKVETETEEGSVEETRRWEFGETAKDFKGTGNKSRKDGPDTDPKTRRWEFGETAKDYEGTGDKSRKTEADTEVKV
ncbi:MAG: hypothetical protein IKJ54_06830, partial [Anaerotignum sp.]|nr:hypothetical protein [Anaerotignum sp.]